MEIRTFADRHGLADAALDELETLIRHLERADRPARSTASWALFPRGSTGPCRMPNGWPSTAMVPASRTASAVTSSGGARCSDHGGRTALGLITPKRTPEAAATSGRSSDQRTSAP